METLPRPSEALQRQTTPHKKRPNNGSMADKDSSNHTNMFPLCEINGSKAATASRSIQHAFTRAIGININRKDLF